jgi:chitin disaccharide deacetylase
VNRGIVEAHRRGIVTSASLMVEMPASGDAARLACECSALSVGLHVQLDGQKESAPDLADIAACREALNSQLAKFIELMGGSPTHLDSHHHIHTDPELLPHFEETARALGIPLRDCSGVRYCSSFYGQWAGEQHPERVSVDGLIQVLETSIGDEVTELGCHPGYADHDLVSSYTIERELELSTLCDDRVRAFIDDREIALIGFDKVPDLV